MFREKAVESTQVEQRKFGYAHLDSYARFTY
jgi:hypothetical protein